MLEIGMAACSEPGLRPENEDAFDTGEHETLHYAVLSDGAGGHARGAEAAHEVVAHMGQALRGASFGAQALGDSVLDAHRRLQSRQPDARGAERMHATVVVLWLDGRRGQVLWSHVGDSRLYRFHYGVVERLTSDDSVVQRLLEVGALTPEQAWAHPMKNQLLAAVGMPEVVEPHTLAAPQNLEDGDAFLLCSDGWWGALEEAEMARMLVEARTPREWVEAMRRCIADRQQAGQDNYSAIAVWASDPEESTRSMEELAGG